MRDTLHSNHVQAARGKAAEACKSVGEKWRQGKKASMPHFTSPHVVYDHRTATFHDEYVSLATVDGRIEADYVLPDEERDTHHAEYFFSDQYETTGAELHYTNGNWMPHIHCKTDFEPDTPEQDTIENGAVLGVDPGMNKSVGRKEEDRLKITLHRISNDLVAEARAHDCSVITFEDLTDIRERTDASWGHKWAFARLYEYIEYKAAEYGINVEQVDPENTSRRYSHCGFTHPDNRGSEAFECLKCGYENHADYNAAKNIG